MIILAVVALAGIGYYTEQSYVVETIDKALSFTTSSKCNVVGDCVEFFISEPPPNRETIPVDYTIETVTNATYYENGTFIEPVSSYVTGNIYDVSYTETGQRISTYKAVGDVMMVQLGNIASIEGQIKLIDPQTKKIVEPRTAKYTFMITCSELSEFCNFKPLVRHGTTTAVGTFIERWTTTTSYSEALYEVEIFALSEQVDQFGIPYEVTNILFLELYR